MKIDFLTGPESEKQYQNLVKYDRGGMGEIYTTLDIISNLTKALKIISFQNQDEHKLFISEFENSISLKHKNIIDIEYYNIGNNNGENFIYCVMEFCENGNLENYIKSQTQQIEFHTCLKLMLDITEGLEFAHNNKIIHRDLKSKNILFDNNYHLKICDFGLSKLIDSRTRINTFKGYGTEGYMAPECWKYETNTIQMDIYSLGIILFEILTLKLPYLCNSTEEYKKCHLFEPLPSISNIRKGLPIKLIEMINKMVSKNPRDRYSSINEIRGILNELQNNNIENDSNLNVLILKAHQRISESEKYKLAQQQKQEKINEEYQLIEYSKKTLINQFNDRVERINENLERDKIVLNNISNSIVIKFNIKEVNISFYPQSDIKEEIKRKKIEFQKVNTDEWGRPKYNYSLEISLERDNIILIGQITTEKFHGSHSWGYNLVLRKENSQDLYGKWYIIWFDDTGFTFPCYYHYAIPTPAFYKEYEIGKSHAIHSKSMNIEEFNISHIDNIINKLFE